MPPYDLQNDPYELKNLANKPELNDTLVFMRNLLANWIADTDDKGRFPEKELIPKWLPNGKQPQLLPLKMEVKYNKIILRSNLTDATIIWKASNDKAWKIYSEPISDDVSFQAKAERIGFSDSAIFKHKKDE